MTHQRSSGRIRRTGVTEYWRSGIPLVDFDIGRPDHLGPLLGFICDEFAEVGGRADERCASEVSQPSLDLGIGEARVDLLVEPVDDFGGCVFWGGRPQTATQPVSRAESSPKSQI